MNKKVILGIGIGTAIIVMILATQNVEIEPKTNMVETNVDFLGADTKCMFHDDVCHGTIQKIIESGIIAQDE